VTLRLGFEPMDRRNLSLQSLALQERRLSVRRRVHIVALLHSHRLCRSVVIEDSMGERSN
jgi:hypothetical protein